MCSLPSAAAFVRPAAAVAAAMVWHGKLSVIILVKSEKRQPAPLHAIERLSWLQAQFKLQSASRVSQGDMQPAEINMEGPQIGTVISSSVRLSPGSPLPAHLKPASQVPNLIPDLCHKSMLAYALL